ncbi:hypothetical protein EDB89DRAFT_879328 [Lactarius sanguifluus]|nr:hypothetical protein EDB89DRAFT_879328 [Lactarius sanguifluus]
MRFLKHLNKYPRGGHVSPSQPVTTPSEFPGRVTIGELSDNLLLNIFRYYLDVSPQHWPRLVHICRRWRRIVFASQQALDLRIFCTHGTPVLKTLDCWPAQPIVVKYGGSLELDPPAPKDEDNILAALKQSERISSISLTITSTLLDKLSAIKRPFKFLELEDLVLLFRDGMPLILPAAFLWGPSLRRLHSTRIAIPTLFHLLRSSTNLVDLQLHEFFDYWLPPEALTNVLSGMAQLQSLSLHFLSGTNYYPHSRGCVQAVLPVLTHLDFRGISRYLECLVAGIDAPRLGDIELTFLDKNIIAFLRLQEFIDRIEMHKSHRRAHILSSEHSIYISLIQPGTPACLKLQLFCEPLSDQLLSLTRVCIHLSACLFNVEDLRISTMRPSGRGDSDYSGLRDLLNSFTRVRRFQVAGNLSTNIVRALQLPDRGDETAIPPLHTLYIARPGPLLAPLKEAVSAFISPRLFGRPTAVEYERPCRVNELRGTEPSSQQLTIEMLSDDIFLNIFRDYLDAAPRTWPTLTNTRSEGSRLLANTAYHRAIWGASRSRPPVSGGR